MKTFHRRSKPKQIKYNGKTYIFDEERTEQFKKEPEDFKGSLLVYVLAKNSHGIPFTKEPVAFIFSKRSRTGFIEGSINDDAAMIAAHG